MVLDSWTLDRTSRISKGLDRYQKDLTSPSLQKYCSSHNKTSKLESDRYNTPGRALIDSLAEELARVPATPFSGSCTPASRHSIDVAALKGKDDSGRFSTVRDRNSSYPTPPKSAMSYLSDSEVQQQYKAGAPYKRPQWAATDTMLPRHRAYREHSENNRMHNSNYIPGIGKLPVVSEDSGHSANVWTRPSTPPTKSASEKKNLHVIEPLTETDLAMEKLRTIMYKQYSAHMDSGRAAMAAERDLFQAFNAFDHNGDGVIFYDEFVDVCSKLDLPGLTEEKIKSLFHVLDVDGDGCIDFYEFMRAHILGSNSQTWEMNVLRKARPQKVSQLVLEQSQHRAKESAALRRSRSTIPAEEIKSSAQHALDTQTHPTVWVALELMRNRIKNMAGVGTLDLYRAFTLFDKDRNGRVTKDEFRNVFKALRIPVSESNLDFIVRQFDADHNGDVDYYEFVKHFIPKDVSVYKPRFR